MTKRQPTEAELGLELKAILDDGYMSPEVKLERLLECVVALVNENLAPAIASARNEAFAAAVHWFEDSEPGTVWDAKAAASEMRALQAQPAAVVPVERVREVLADYIPTERDRKEALRRLGVDLDATPAKLGPPHREDEAGCMADCPGCSNE